MPLFTHHPNNSKKPHITPLLLALSLLLMVGCQTPGDAGNNLTGTETGSAPLSASAPSSPAQPEKAPEPPAEMLQKGQLPASVLLTVQNIFQNPELPNGCEATSLTMALNYFGADTDKMDIAYNWMSLQAFDYSEYAKIGGDPELVYTGDPAGDGYYCFAAPVAQAANLFMQENDMAYTAYDITGATENELLAHLADGYPVIVWTTIDNSEPYAQESNAWMIADTGEWYVPYSNLHVIVLLGYDEENFYFSDPLGQYPSLPRSEFTLRYTQMGSRAVVIY